MRRVVRAAYSGRWAGSSDSGCCCSSASGCSRCLLASARNARSPRIRRIASSSHRVNKRAQPPTEIGTITRMSAIPIVACRCHTIFMKIAAAIAHQRPRASRVDITSARRWSKQLRKRRCHFRSSRRKRGPWMLAVLDSRCRGNERESVLRALFSSAAPSRRRRARARSGTETRSWSRARSRYRTACRDSAAASPAARRRGCGRPRPASAPPAARPRR